MKNNKKTKDGRVNTLSGIAMSWNQFTHLEKLQKKVS